MFDEKVYSLDEIIEIILKMQAQMGLLLSLLISKGVATAEEVEEYMKVDNMKIVYDKMKNELNKED